MASPSPVSGREDSRQKPSRLARRARSFKEDLLDKLNNLKSPGQMVRSHSPIGRPGLAKQRSASRERRASAHQDIGVAYKEVEFALRYFDDVVQKGTLEMLSGSATAVLESVVQLHTLVMNRVGDKQSPSALSTSKLMNQSLAELVRWSNGVLVMGLQPGQTAAGVVSGVRKTIAALMALAESESARGRTPVSGTNSTPTGNGANGRRSHGASLPDLTCPKPAISQCGAQFSLSTDSVLDHRQAEDSPPPKPPLATSVANRPASVSDASDLAPPLPPKRRSKKLSPALVPCSPVGCFTAPISASEVVFHSSSTTSSTETTKVRGATRRFAPRAVSSDKSPESVSPATSLESALNQSQDDSYLHWSKRDSYSSVGNSSGSSTRDSRLDSTATSDSSFCNIGLDQYGNWRTPTGGTAQTPADITVITEQLRQLSGRHHTLTLSVPPALPPKRRQPPPTSQYDNLPSGDRTPVRTGVSTQSTPPAFDPDPVVLRKPRRDGIDVPDTSRPPPLPLKKKHVLSYMEMVGDYSQPSQTEFLRQSSMSYTNYAAHWAVSTHEMAASRSYSLAEHLRSSSEDSGDSELFEHKPLVEELSPPALPPKRTSDIVAPPPTTRQSARTSVQPPTSPTGAVTTTTASVESDNALLRLDVESLLVYKDPEEEGPELRGGSVDSLVAYATRAYKNDFVYQEAFLTTYRTFLTPKALIDKLLYRYDYFYNSADPAGQRAAKYAFSLLVRVVDDLALSDLSQSLVEELMAFEVRLLSSGDMMLARALRSKILEKYEAKKRFENPQRDLPGFFDRNSRSSSLLDFKSEHLAEQMTMLDSKLFAKIEIPEVLVWAQEQNEEKSPNLTAFTEHFNNMSYWTRSRILEQQEAKDREKFILKFIKIMKHLRKMNNFNSYLAILSALDSAPVRRLEWQKQIAESLREYCALIDSSSSFRAYRQALGEATPPCIPYIGLILQDLTFVHVGNPDWLSDGVVNFAKRWQQFNILDSMRRFKKGIHAFKPHAKVIQFFDNFEDCLSEEEMWRISETIKPRGKARK